MKARFARGGILIAGLAAVFLLTSGCRTTTVSGLPPHIRTVEVHLFKNTTMYKGIEAHVTRRLIDRINGDPNVRVVREGGDAILTGEITNVTRGTLRETTTNEPATMMVVVHAEYSFYDVVERKSLAAEVPLNSRATGMSPGLYETDLVGSTPTATEISASNALADEIVRRTIGMW